jgi:hypothetical protein
VFIAGANAAVSITNGLGAGLTITGTVKGVSITGSAGPGLYAIGTTNGLYVESTTGDAVCFKTTNWQGNGLTLIGAGGASGLLATGGDSAGAGIRAVAGAGGYDILGNIQGNLSGSVNNVATAVTLPTIPNDWITAAGIANGAIDNATFAADVGSTAYASNIIALAADKATFLKPTVAGRTLDVTTTGEAGIDWSNVGAPTTTLALTGTTMSASQHVIADSGTVTTVTNGVLVSVGTSAGQINVAAGVVPASGNWNTTTPPTAAAIADAVLDEAAVGHTGLIPTNLDAKVSTISGGGSAAGTGAHTITVTVVDGDSDPIENVAVRYTSGASTYVGTSDVDGEVVFNLDEATYVVAATRLGYSFAGTTHTVIGDDAKTIVMTTITIAPSSDPGQTMAFGVAEDSQGGTEPDILVTIELLIPTTAGQHGRALIHATSGADGTYQVPLLKAATYRIWRSGGPISKRKFTTGTADTYELPVI